MMLAAIAWSDARQRRKGLFIGPVQRYLAGFCRIFGNPLEIIGHVDMGTVVSPVR